MGELEWGMSGERKTRSEETKRIRRLLVANRGEIAIRIFRTCKQLGITCLAIYSEADQNAAHVQWADEAYCVGPAPSSESYLRGDAILAIAQQASACAIHPGYGFLSENATFAQSVVDAGLLWIGPPASAIAAMGSKIAAKQLLQQHENIPLIPGSASPIQSARAIQEEAQRLGFPVLLKASAGGGGKGMRVVHHAEDLPQALEEAQREALTSFGDDAMLLEKYFEQVKHIEVQLIGDHYGTISHLFERECSVQRRHQKVMEEAPAPALSESVRSRLYEVAETIGRTIGYTSVGTVEFIYEPTSQAFYFLEVNTRLQVEHPVTEAITGLDLVAWQIRVAEGHSLESLGGGTLSWRDKGPQGHAVECRLCAEDPENQFFPSTGRVLAWQPVEGDGIRYDSAIQVGSEVSVFYDSLLAKIIVWAPDRPTALQRMEETLRHTVLLGVSSNRDFLLRVVQHADVQQAARCSTAFIATHFPPSTLTSLVQSTWLHHQEGVLSAALLASWAQRHTQRTLLRHVPSGWRNNPSAFPRTYWKVLTCREEEKAVLVSYRCITSFPQVVGSVFEIQLTPSDGTQAHPIKRWEILRYDPSRHHLTLASEGQQWTLWALPDPTMSSRWHVHAYAWGSYTVDRWSALQYQAEATQEEEDDSGDLMAPMPARVLEIAVQDGSSVQEGDLIVVVESMKMQNSYRAPCAGTVRLYVTENQLVPARTLLASVQGQAPSE